MRHRGFIALAVVAFAMAACGGGGGGSTPSGSAALPVAVPTLTPASSSTTPPSSAQPAGYAVAKMSITFTPSSSTSSSTVRRAKTVGVGTNSIAFTLLQQNGAGVSAATPQVFGLTATSPGCTSSSGGSLTCILPVSAPIGSDIFLAQTYTGTSGAGAGSSLTGSGAVALTVQQNATNTASLSLTGQVASIVLASSSCYLGVSPYTCQYFGEDSVARRAAAGTRRVLSTVAVPSMRVYVIALDSAQNTILNPSTYDTPITLELIYSDSYYQGGYPSIAPVPDVSLAVAYSPSIDPSGCGGSSSTSANYGAIQVCSPSDVITASLVDVPNGTIGALIYGSIGTTIAIPSPAPSTYPSPFPAATPTGQAFIVFPVTVSATPTPVPTTSPTPGLGTLAWSSPTGDPRFSPAYYTFENAAFTFVSLTDGPAQLAVTPSGATPPYTGTMTLTADTTCAANLTATPAFGTSGALNSTTGAYPVTLVLNAPSAPFSCNVTATEDSEPTVTSVLTVSANSYGVTVQSKGRVR